MNIFSFLKKLFLWAAFCCLPMIVYAQNTMSFDELWVLLKNHSPEIEQAQQSYEAARISYRRSKPYFLPKAQVHSGVFTSNDAGSVLFSKLGERSVNAGDFAPDALNHPGYEQFSKTSLMIDWPLFQGGMNQSLKKVTRHMESARDYERKSVVSSHYAQRVVEYALLLAGQEKEESLQKIDRASSEFMKKYELTSSKNPVGYSGALGLKALLNRLQAMKSQAAAEKVVLKASLSERSGLSVGSWTPQKENISAFLKKHLGGSIKASLPPHVAAAQAQAKAIKASVAMERAQFLPQLGLFGQTDMTVGARDHATATTLGGYMRWNILSPTQYGAVKEKKLQAQAMENQAAAQELQARIDAQQSREGIEALLESIRLMKESAHFLDQQMQMANELYQSGGLSVLQLADLLNRQADLTDQIYQSYTALSSSFAKNYIQQGASGD